MDCYIVPPHTILGQLYYKREFRENILLKAVNTTKNLGSHKPFATASKLQFLIGGTHFALAAIGSAPLGCDFPDPFGRFVVAVVGC